MERRHGRRSAVARRGQAVSRRLAAHGIVVPRPRDVNAYLRQHPDLAELVPLVGAAARRVFEGPTELSLELYRDPEIDDAYLTLYVRPAKYGTDLLARIHRVAESYEKELAEASGHFLVTSDFRAPRNEHGL